MFPSKASIAHSVAETPSVFSRDFTATILACAIYCKQSRNSKRPTGAHISKLELFLSDSLLAMSTLAESIYPGWTADEQNPGFLVRIEPPAFFRVPVHLIGVFPTGAALMKVWEIANSVRTHESSILSISGSNVVREILEYVDDVDFCEYAPLNGQELADAVEQKFADVKNRICLSLKVGKLRWDRPFVEPEIRSTLEITNHASEDGATVKVDYMYTVSTGRPYDVSNVIIVCNDNFESVGFEKTFAFQEAQVTAVDYVPNRLARALELGRYVLWLIGQIDHYRTNGDLAKCLKRSLSLSRVCWLNSFSEEIKRLFENSCLAVDQEIATSEQMLQSVRASGALDHAEQLQRHIGLLRAERVAFSYKESITFPNGASPAATEIIERLLAEIATRSGGALA